MAITGYDVLQDAKTIKEIKTKQDENSQEILNINEQLGDMTQVPTTSKTASGAITELFTDVSDGKSLIGGAITDVDDSVVIPTEPTFQDLASAVGGISTGKKWASGNFSIPVTKYSTSASATMPISQVGFTPTLFFAPVYISESSSGYNISGVASNIRSLTGKSNGVPTPAMSVTITSNAISFYVSVYGGLSGSTIGFTWYAFE